MSEKISLELQEELKKLRLARVPKRIRVIVELKTVPKVAEASMFVVDFRAEVVYQSKVAPLLSMKVDYAVVEKIAQLPSVKRVWHVPEFKPLTLLPATGLSVTLIDTAKHLNIDAVKAAGYSGEGILVAVVDSGIDKTHPMFNGQIVAERNFNPDVPPDDVSDVTGHGTWTASCVAGKYWKSPTGIDLEGMAPNAKLIIAKCFHGAGVTADVLMQGLEWSCEEGAQISSNSWGGPRYDPLRILITNLKEQYGTIFVFAAGNEGPENPIIYPGGYPEVICVGSIAVKNPAPNVVADFSCRGPGYGGGIKPDVMAPGGTNNLEGEEIVCAAGLLQSVKCIKGTSMATPHISGGLALLLEAGLANPVEQMYNRALDLVDVGKDNDSGFGTADFAKVMDLAPLNPHLLTIEASLVGVPIKVNNGIHVTPWSGQLREDAYVVSAPKTVFVDNHIYEFVAWEDGEISRIRMIDLTADLVLRAVYTKLNAYVLYAMENARVDQAYPNVNFGGEVFTRAMTNASSRGILKFDLTGLPEGLEITEAKLYLTIYWRRPKASRQIEAYGVPDDSWRENTITWNNKPTLGEILSSRTVDSEATFEWNITPFVKSEYVGDKILSLLIKDSVEEVPSDFSYEVFFVTRNAVKNPPYIIVSYPGLPTGTLEVHAYIG